MKPIPYIIAFSIVLLMACASCSKRVPDLQDPVSSVRRYADSFSGLSLDEVRTKLAGGTLTEEEWKGQDFKGTQLVATFPDYQIRVFLLEGKAIKTSIQIISR